MKRIIPLISVFSLLLAVFFFDKVQAASFEGLSVFPANYEAGAEGSSARFDLELYPGESHQDAIKISNKSGKDNTYKIFAADGKTTADGAFALAGVNDPKTEVASWITLEKDEVTIPNGSEAVINFTVKVPSNTEVGDHLGGISVFDTNQNQKQTDDNGFVLNITTRVGVRIYITVPGEIVKKMELVDFNGGLDPKTDKVVLDFGLKNSGNVRVEPKGEITILNSILGSSVQSFPVDLRMVLPGNPTRVPIIWDKTPLAGKYTVRANINYGDQPDQIIQQDYELFFITKKAKLIAAGAGVILLGFILILVRKLAKHN